MRIMRILIIPAIAIAIAFTFGACKSSSAKMFCDTVCLKDTLKYYGEYKLKPYVFISTKNCLADTLIWSYDGMGVNRKAGLSDFLNTTVNFNKNFIRCFIKDTAYAWLLFNDCATGRGYQLKLPFNKTNTIGRKSNGINNLDPKFSITDNLVANTDKGNLYIEDMVTGKKAMMTFGRALDFSYDNIHQALDSVNVTDTRIWVKVKIDNKWKMLEKNITLQ